MTCVKYLYTECRIFQHIFYPFRQKVSGFGLIVRDSRFQFKPAERYCLSKQQVVQYPFNRAPKLAYLLLFMEVNQFSIVS